MPELEAGEPAEADAARARQQARAELDARAAVLAGRRRDLEVRAAGLAERAQLLQDRLDDTERRLAADAEARAAAEQRRTEVERSLAALDRLAALVDGHRTVVDAHHGELVERRRQQSEEVRALAARLDELRADRTAAERSLDEVRERARRAEVDEAEARLRLESAVEMLRHDLDVEPDAAEAAEAPPLPEGVSAQARVARARPRAAPARADQPARPRGVHRAAAAPRVPRGAARGRAHDAPRAEPGDPGRRQEIQSVFAAAFADVSANFAHAVRRRCSRAASGGSCSPSPTTCSTPASRSRPSRAARTSRSCRCCRAASAA